MERTVQQAQASAQAKPSHRSAVLWTVQILLALLFVFSGVMKFVLPAAVLTQNSPLSVTFIP
jgi:uncharacterized membrane protein YphA (DoxX/SURF4 family)